jgi:hypothetical protein
MPDGQVRPSPLPLRDQPQSFAEGVRAFRASRRRNSAALPTLHWSTSIHRRSVASVVAEARHLDHYGTPKTLTQIGREIGTTMGSTVRKH